MKNLDKPIIPKFSKKELLVLNLLIGSKSGKLFGLDMVEQSNGELKRGTVYVTLHRMEEKGFIESTLEPRLAPEIGIARRFYSATGLGERLYRAQEAAARVFFENLVPAMG